MPDVIINVAVFFAGLGIGYLLFKPTAPDVNPKKLLALLLCLSLATGPACAKGRAKVVKASVSLEQTLGTLQDTLRHICDPSVTFPNTISACTSESAGLGLTTARFRQISAALAKAFDFIANSLALALRLWKAGDPVPKEYGQFFALIDDAVRLVRQSVTNAKAQEVFAAISIVTAALGALGDRLLGS